MRLLLAVLLVVPALACKKPVASTVARYPDSTLRPTSDPVATPEATLVHVILRAGDKAPAILNFYKSDLEARAAHRVGETYEHENLAHQGGFGLDGFVTVKDPSKPGVWLGVADSGTSTADIDIWENIPKAP